MVTVLITFPCLHSKKKEPIFKMACSGTKPQPGKKQRKQRCRIAKYFPSSRLTASM